MPLQAPPGIIERYIKQIRAQLGGEKLSRDVTQEFLAFWASNWVPPTGVVDHMESSEQRAVLSRVIYELATGNVDGARELTTTYGIDGRCLTMSAELALDITLVTIKPEPAYNIISQFLLDQERFTQGTLLYVQWLVRLKRLEEAMEIMSQASGNLIGSLSREVAARLFRETMAFEPEITRRDYGAGMAVADMFRMDFNATYELANQEYEFNMFHRRYETAASLGKFFNLGSVKTKEAAFKAFESYIQYFRQQLERGYYEENAPATVNDPYRRAVYLMQEYFQQAQHIALDETGRTYLRKVLDIAFFLAKKLTSQKDSDKIGFHTRTLFTTSLINDFRLDVSIVPDQAQQVSSMIGWIAEQVDEVLRDPELTRQFHHSVQRLYGLFSPHKALLRRIGMRMFHFYVRENDLRTAHALYVDMKLPEKDVTVALQERALIWVSRGQHSRFKDMVALFQLEHAVRNNADVNRRLLEQFIIEIENQNWEGADILDSVMSFPRKNVIKSVSKVIQKLLQRRNDQLALELLQRFKIPLHMIRLLFIREYLTRAEQSWANALAFRQYFRLSPFEVGLWNWFTHEWMRMERLHAMINKKPVPPGAGSTQQAHE